MVCSRPVLGYTNGMSRQSGTVVALLAQSDDALDVLRHAEEILDRFGVAWATSSVYDVDRVVPDLHAGGVEVFIVANTSAKPLSAQVAALTTRPVLAVPLPGDGISPLEALEATAAPGPPEAPVGTFAIGKAGAINAALYAVAILAGPNPNLRAKLEDFRRQQTDNVLKERLD
jgi:5-(carboxyamino)imidazole ribonucleotide mutase